MDTYKETFETWNKIASLYQAKFMDLDLYNESYDLFCNSINNEKAKLLEIGCGPGNITRYLLSKRPDFTIYGIDISPNMIELAKANNPSASFDVMDCREISIIQSKFDGVVCGFCFPYLSQSDVSKLISDCYNLLTTGGVLYMSFVEGEPGKSGFQSGNSGDRAYFYYHRLKNINQLLVDNNFEKTDTFIVRYKKDNDTEDIHTVLIAKKKNDGITNVLPVNGA